MKRGLVRIVLAGTCLFGVAIALWLLSPTVASLCLEQWLLRAGFTEVSIHVGLPGWRRVAIPQIRLKQFLEGERLIVESTNAVLEYSLAGVLAGRLDQVLLPDVLFALVSSASADLNAPPKEKVRVPIQSFSLLNMLTVSDLVQGLPVLPFDQLQLGRLKITREQATGPLREVSVAGTIRQRSEGLLAELAFQGEGTQVYVLRISDLAAGVMSAELTARAPSSRPIFTWRSEAVAGEAQSQLRGMFDVNIQELAPFLALILPVGSEWQLVTGRIRANWTGTASSISALASVWRDPNTRLTGTLQISVNLPELKGIGRKLVMAVSARFSGNPARFDWSIDQGKIMAVDIETRQIGALESVRDFLPRGTQTLLVESAQGVNGELRWSESPPKLIARGPLTLSYEAAKDPMHADLVLAHLVVRGRLIETAEGRFNIVGAFPRTISERLSLKKITGNIEGRMALKDGDIFGTILPSSALTATRFQQGVIRVARGTIRLSEAVHYRFAPTTGEWTAGPSTMTLRLPKIQLDGQEISLQEATLRMEGAGRLLAAWDGRGTAMIQGLTFHQATGRSAPVRLTVTIAADAAAIKADIQGDVQDHMLTLSAQVQHILATGRGALSGTLGPVNFDHNAVRLRQLWSPWPFPIDVTGGRAKATVDLAWDSQASDTGVVISGTKEAVLENVAGQYGDFVFTGLNTTLHVSTKLPDAVATMRPAEVKLAFLSRGITATGISLTVQADWNMRASLPIVEVRDVRWQLLGGTMTSQGLRADLSQPSHSFTVLARGVDLAKVLSLEQQKGLQGTGLLDGAVPISVGMRGVTVKDALFEARPPGGVIQYQASPEAIKAMTEANANMQLVLQALNNFHYNVLQVGAQYAADGMLNLKARLEGRNPDLKKTPPVHFNLTVQENIPTLLKSLRLVQDIGKSVQNRLVQP